ncbi:hypothetical protein NDU88_001804 [Pleurodeles waltl]|uniref:Uncharacterized protein n=1 Tax=Pleurodeles waltl TaxID=8319 RepID=A0AAV7Q835_PLEWA|nr:hypothetical protein NDU88_001804 [Pleurodeles waltl]
MPRSKMCVSELKAIPVNVRSLHKRALDIFDILKDESIDLLFSTKTWLKEASCPDLYVALPEAIPVPI